MLGRKMAINPELRHILAALRAFIQRQHAANDGVTLAALRRGAVPKYRVHPGFLPFLTAQREGVLRILTSDRADGLVGELAAAAEAYVHRHNQFIELTAEERLALATVYRHYVDGLAEVVRLAANTSDLECGFWAVQAVHRERLSEFVAVLAERRGPHGGALVDAQVVCAEYSPGLQLAALGLDSGQPPVLDVGCGRAGALVRHLRDQGIEAYGIDRVVEPSEHLATADWLSYDYGSRKWGTIVSHLAFSNHFAFQLLFPDGRSADYARALAGMLDGLRVGGALCYTPGLPEIERLFDRSRFRMVRRPLPSDLGSLIPGGYATRLERLR